MSATLFHSSERSFKPGDVVGSRLHLGKRIKMVLGWDFRAKTEAVLAQSRPRNAPHRLSALFACRTLAECQVFANAESNAGAAEERKFYRVEMHDPWPAPMALVHRLTKALEYGELRQRIACEYWRRKHEWRFLEQLGLEMKIVGVEEPLDPLDMDLLAAQNAYHDDFQKAQARFPRP